MSFIVTVHESPFTMTKRPPPMTSHLSTEEAKKVTPISLHCALRVGESEGYVILTTLQVFNAHLHCVKANFTAVSVLKTISCKDGSACFRFVCDLPVPDFELHPATIADLKVG